MIARLTIVLALGWMFGGTAVRGDEPLRMNQIQTIATHNSYHVRTSNHPDWQYDFPPLDRQLDLGVRGFEIDVYYQPDGYFQVLHVPRFDAGTTCERFADCLRVIRDWSAANPNHVPIIVHIELKDEQYQAVPVTIHPINRPELDLLDAQVREVFEPDHLITPDDLRRGHASVREGLENEGWPLLDEVRGKCVFIIHNRGRHREEWLRDQPTLEGRALFNFAAPGAPDAAFLIRDNPGADDLPELVRAGYMIRTRAGAPDSPDRDRDRRAFASGAQLVSTDYPKGIPHEATGYVLEFPEGGLLRANPVTAPDYEGTLKE